MSREDPLQRFQNPAGPYSQGLGIQAGSTLRSIALAWEGILRSSRLSPACDGQEERDEKGCRILSGRQNQSPFG